VFIVGRRYIHIIIMYLLPSSFSLSLSILLIAPTYIRSFLSLLSHSLHDCTLYRYYPRIRTPTFIGTRIHGCPNIYPYGKNPKENINICVCGRKLRQYKVYNTFVYILYIPINHMEHEYRTPLLSSPSQTHIIYNYVF